MRKLFLRILSNISNNSNLLFAACVISDGIRAFNHYEITPMQYTVIFNGCKNSKEYRLLILLQGKNDDFQMKNYDIFLIFALKH